MALESNSTTLEDLIIESEAKFPYQEVDATFVQTNADDDEKDDFLCILGGCGDNESNFVEIKCETKENHVSTKFSDFAMNNNINYSNASLNILDKAVTNRGISSYLVKNTSNNGHWCIITITRHSGYSCYDCETDEWTTANSKDITLTNDNICALLISNKLLIITQKDEMILYDLTNLNKPRRIFSDELEEPQCWEEDDEEWPGYVSHGMCLVSFNQNSEIKFVLFGGMRHDPFFKSMLEVSVQFRNENFLDNLNMMNEDNFKNWAKIVQIQIEDVKCDKDAAHIVKRKDVWQFGYDLVIDKKTNEKIIVIIGGENNKSHIVMWNYSTNRISRIVQKRNKNIASNTSNSNSSNSSASSNGHIMNKSRKLLPLDCKQRAATRKHGNHIHCIYQSTHFLISLTTLTYFFDKTRTNANKKNSEKENNIIKMLDESSHHPQQQEQQQQQQAKKTQQIQAKNESKSNHENTEPKSQSQKPMTTENKMQEENMDNDDDIVTTTNVNSVTNTATVNNITSVDNQDHATTAASTAGSALVTGRDVASTPQADIENGNSILLPLDGLKRKHDSSIGDTDNDQQDQQPTITSTVTLSREADYTIPLTGTALSTGIQSSQDDHESKELSQEELGQLLTCLFCCRFFYVAVALFLSFGLLLTLFFCILLVFFVLCDTKPEMIILGYCFVLFTFYFLLFTLEKLKRKRN